MQLTRFRSIELCKDSVARLDFSVSLLDGTSAFDLRILYQRCNLRERVSVEIMHVVNNDTTMHAVHCYTVAFSAQF